MIREAAEFQRHLDAVKTKLKAPFDWYPYDSFGNVPALNKLLGPKLAIRDIALNSGDDVLDIGCADGAMAFFLESQGCHVDAVDLPSTNYNQMQGIRALKPALQSKVDIREMDLDSQFQLEKTYGLALFLGLLYHLKNPFYALETLARHARFCLLSTRVAAVTSSGQPIREEPVAYLLDGDEANNDCTNFWIFSEAGLRRIATRAGWEVRGFLTSGCPEGSNPKDSDRDERAFCFLESRWAPPAIPVQLHKGWNQVEDNWRWTERIFSVTTAAPLSNQINTLNFTFHHMHGFPITLHATVEGVPLASARFTAPGEHVYRAKVPAAVLSKRSLEIEFTLDRAEPPNHLDLRERGVIVSFFRNRYPDSDQNLPLTFT